MMKENIRKAQSEVGITSLSIPDAATLFYSLEAPLLLIFSSSRGVPGTAKIFYNIFQQIHYDYLSLLHRWQQTIHAIWNPAFFHLVFLCSMGRASVSFFTKVIYSILFPRLLRTSLIQATASHGDPKAFLWMFEGKYFSPLCPIALSLRGVQVRGLAPAPCPPQASEGERSRLDTTSCLVGFVKPRPFLSLTPGKTSSDIYTSVKHPSQAVFGNIIFFSPQKSFPFSMCLNLHLVFISFRI